MISTVCNASPLIFLAKINSLNLLDDYAIVIPEQVYSEILKGSGKQEDDPATILKYLKGGGDYTYQG